MSTTIENNTFEFTNGMWKKKRVRLEKNKTKKECIFF